MSTTIYDAIGGQDALVAVVDDFYDRVLADPRLAPFFAGIRMTALKGKQVEFFTTVLGGPQIYQGPSMREVHAGRGIGQADFDRVAYHLTAALTDAGVPGHIVDQIIGGIAPLADDIVARNVHQ